MNDNAKKKDCLCPPHTPCGYRLIDAATDRAMRAEGFKTRKRLQYGLAGPYTRECQFRAYKALRALAS